MRARNRAGFSLSPSSDGLDLTVFGVPRIAPFRPPTTICFGDRKIEVPTTVPRLLLGPEFGEAERFVFCPFGETLDAFRRGDLSVASEIKRVPGSAGLERFDIGAVVRAGEERGDTHVVLASAMYRISRCQRLMDKRPSPGLAYHLQLFVDTHLDLFSYMLEHREFSDGKLLDAWENRDDLARSVVEQYEPSDRSVTHAGDLPDLTPLADAGDVWREMKTKTLRKSVAATIVHIVFCKTLAHKCLIRNFRDILSEGLASQPILLELFRMVIEISALGNYPHARSRPSFARRIEIRRAFHGRRALDDEELLCWMRTNNLFVYWATKELHVFMLERQYAMDVAMCESLKWTGAKGVTVGAMDSARRLIDCDPTQFEGGTFSAVETELARRHQNWLAYITKLKKASFEESVLQWMEKVFRTRILRKKSAAVQTCETALADIVKGEIIALLRRMEAAVEELVPRVQNEVLELELLMRRFAVTGPGVDAICSLRADYENGSAADNAMIRRMTAIYEDSERDFCIMHVFFSMVRDRRAFASHALSLRCAERQTAALRAKLWLGPWDPLPDAADRYYYCSVCERWLAPTVESKVKRSRRAEHAQGCDSVLYDHGTQGLYCGRQKMSVSIKRMMDAGLYHGNGDVDDEKDARGIRRAKEKSRCYATRAIPVAMIGRVQCLGKALWAMCEDCASLTLWEAGKFGQLGFTCGRHHARSASDDAGIRGLRGDVDREGGSDDGEKEKPSECVYCEVLVLGASEIRAVRIVEDVKISGDAEAFKDNEIGSLRYVSVVLCKADYARCRALFSDGAIALKSEVFAEIARARKYSGMPGPCGRRRKPIAPTRV